MGYKMGCSIGYGIIFLAYEAIVLLLMGFDRPGVWLGLACTALVLGLCLAAVWKDTFQTGIVHLPMALGAVLTIFFVLQLAAGVIVIFLPLKWGAIVEIMLVAACLLCGGGTVLGGRMIVEREKENRARREVRKGLEGEEKV